ncbi:MAG: hemolysin family protein [Acidimicrobiia bacterium]
MLAVSALILANAFFVAGEFALVAVERNRVERLAEEGSRRAGRVLEALRSLSFQLSGAQLGITVTTLVLGFLAEPTIAVLLEPLLEAVPWIPEGSTLGISIGLALALATVVQMVVGELLPKNLAIARPLASAMVIAAPMQFVNSLLRPVIVFLNESANWTVRLLGIQPMEELAGVRSVEELELAIRSSGEEGRIDDVELALLTRSIEFAERIAADVMVPRVSVIALAKDQTLADLRDAALESGHSRFPVYGEDLDEVIGTVHVKDSIAFPREERASTPVTPIVQPALVVPEARRLDAVLVDMQRAGKQLALVVDEYGGTAGIITAEDLLEEIFGEIEDEHDPGAARTADERALDGTAKVVSGLLHRGEVREATGFELPEGRYETLGGFLIDRLGRFPEEGELVEVDGWTFEVLGLESYRVGLVAVAPPLRMTQNAEGE